MTVHRIPMCKCGHELHPEGPCPSCGCASSRKRGSPVAHESGGLSSDAINDLARIARTLELAAVAIRDYAKTITAALGARGPGRRSNRSQISPAATPHTAHAADIAWERSGRIVPKAARDSDLGKGELRVLTACAQHRAGVTVEQITVLLGYKRSTRNTYLQRLTEAGLVGRSAFNTERIMATEAGLAELGPDFKRLPTGNALRAHWMSELGGGEQELLAIICNEHPSFIDREELSERTEYARSTRNTYLQRLRARSLIIESGDSVRAVDDLFDVVKDVAS